MNGPCFYEIRVQGQLPSGWSDWFSGLAIHSDPNGETALQGTLSDQSELFGVLTRIHALNLTLISINSLEVRPLK
jgi:hypothetical protein